MKTSFTLCALVLLAAPTVARERTVLAAVDASGLVRAWHSNERGLVLTGWRADGARLVLGDAAYPRFTDSGALHFERVTDDGHHVLTEETLVLARGSIVPRALRSGEPTPARPGGPPTGAPRSTRYRICVDAGHGGSDPGAQGFGVDEADMNLDVAQRLEALLLADDADPTGGGEWDVLMTRTADVDVSLASRTSMANAFGADRFLSIHHNAFSSSAANGTETYSFAEGTTSALLRDDVHAEMISAWGLNDRGTKTAGFYVLVNTTMPAELAELGFITSPIDIAKITDPNERQNAARAHLFAIQRHFGITPYDPGTPPPTAGTLKGVLFDATVGTGARIAGGTVALADGTFAVADGLGYFEFDLPAGTYSLAGTAPGYAATGSSETVTSGDVWESLPLAPATLPTLTLDPYPLAGAPLGLAVGADPLSPVWVFFNGSPGLPLVSYGAYGAGWPAAGGAGNAFLGLVPGGGVLSSPVLAPGGAGNTVHLAALAFVGGAARLSNGAAFQVQ